MRLLLISNSTNSGEDYLAHPLGAISQFLGDIGRVVFVPYAAVTFSYDKYLEKVQGRFDVLSVEVDSVHKHSDPASVIAQAHAIVVGGGNTFALLDKLQKHNLLDAIRERVGQGIPYIGWSAGSNVASPTINTTNDMPIVQPASFKSIGLVPFQINPHYTDAVLPNHAGETRQQRIEEYTTANRSVWVVGLREGSMLQCEGKKVELLGDKPARVFYDGREPIEVAPGGDLSFLMK